MAHQRTQGVTAHAVAPFLLLVARGLRIFLSSPSGATVKLLRSLVRTARPIVVWSQWSGYLKKGGPVQRFCDENGIEPYIIHSGGHAHPEDLADLARRLLPRAVVPIHTEAASQFAAFISNVREVADGEAIEVASLIADYDRRTELLAE